MRTLLLFCLVLLSLPSFSQESESKWNLHASVSPQVCYRLFNGGDKLSGNEYSTITPKSIFGFSAAVAISRKVSSKWSIELGLSITQCGFEELTVNSNLKVNDPNDPVYLAMVKSRKAITRFTFAGIPLRVCRTWGQGRFGPVFSVGLVPVLLIGSNEKSESTTFGGTYSTTDGDVTESYHDYSLFFETGMGIEYNHNSRLGFRAIPYLSLGILKLDNQVYNYHLFQAGLRVGGFYRF